MENELSGWSKIDHDVKVRVVQVFRGEGVVVSAKWDKYVLAFVKSTCKYSLGETIQPGVYIPCGKATFKNSAGVKTTVPAFLQLNPAEAKHMVQKLVSELDKEADKRVKNAEEAKRIEAKRRTAKLDYDAKVAKAKLEAEADKKLFEFETKRLDAVHKRNKEMLQDQWNLIRKHKLDDSLRVAESDLLALIEILKDPDPTHIYPRIEPMKSRFPFFPVP